MGIGRLSIDVTGAVPIRQALTRTDCRLFAAVAEGMRPGVSAAEAWKAARASLRQRGGALDALDDGDMAALDQMFDALGQSGRSGQALVLSNALERLRQSRDEARSRAGDGLRLYTTVGFLSGLILALAVI